jgi:hypothetical protein
LGIFSKSLNFGGKKKKKRNWRLSWFKTMTHPSKKSVQTKIQWQGGTNRFQPAQGNSDSGSAYESLDESSSDESVGAVQKLYAACLPNHLKLKKVSD